ncbi:YoaK family protein [Sphingobacterium chungjuense]|uniref:YoaK family protein n=1 Tax=Sphingobacterium chungjuense TaxID=2675553 RepID=UPI00140B5550|nr:YoaK family protein [Sphingobacterium chungjuense]
MLRKYSNHRTQGDNLKLGALTALSAGMTNVVSVIVFFSYTSNITGHYAVFAQEVSRGNVYQAAVVLFWILLFFSGSFLSNFVIIQGKDRISSYLAHAIPIMLEFLGILAVGIYLQFFYTDTLLETEFLVGILLFAMGLQNGLTASISNSVIKTTHLTGLTTDLAILVSMFTKRNNRSDEQLVKKFHLLLVIMSCYVAGGIISGVSYNFLGNATFFVVCFMLMFIAFYDFYKLRRTKKVYDNRHESPEENELNYGTLQDKSKNSEEDNK